MSKQSEKVCNLPFGGQIYMILNDDTPPTYRYYWYNTLVIGEFGPFLDSASALRHYKSYEMSVNLPLTHSTGGNVIQVDFKARKKV